MHTDERFSVGIDTLGLNAHQHTTPQLVAPPTDGSQQLLLLGLMSGALARRELIRCTWGRGLPRAIRLRFVVGAGTTDRASHDVLEATDTHDVGFRPGGASDTMHIAFFKMVFFLRFAAQQPEPAIGIGDDDIFVSPPALLAYSWRLPVTAGEAFGGVGSTAWLAGYFDWYSMFTRRLSPTAWARELGSALWHAEKPRRNCSRDLSGAAGPMGAERGGDGGDGGGCVGPFAFAKGPLLLLSDVAVRWVLSSAAFARDVARARALAAERAKAGTSQNRRRQGRRILDDATLGYWLRLHPSLVLVALPKFAAWANEWRHVGPVEQLLVAHRAPYDQWAWLAAQTDEAWRGRGVLARARCPGHEASPGPCRPGLCAHAAGQRACSLAVQPLLSADAARPICRACACDVWLANGSRMHASGGTCNFSRLARPVLPAHCAWRAGAGSTV